MKLTKLVSLKKFVVVFSLLVGSAVLYTISSFPTSIFIDSQDRQELQRNNYLQPQRAKYGGPLTRMEQFVVTLITSAPFHTHQRQAVRRTWLSLLANNSVALGRSNIRAMKDPTDTSNNLVIQYWFVCGHYYDKENKVEAAVENETQVYGDILRLEYTETYSLLVYKTLSSLRFASTMDVKFVVKVDDDVYLHVPRMIWWLKTASLPEKLYAGHLLDRSIVIRKTNHKYYVSEHIFNETFFPPYCNGPFYILSKIVLPELLEASSSDNASSFPLEDAYLGILAKRVGIKPTNLLGKGVRLEPKFPRIAEKKWDDFTLNNFFALGHNLSTERLFAFHERFLKLPLIML